jgi:hypothetical protein
VFKAWWENFCKSAIYYRTKRRVHLAYKNCGVVYTKIGWRAAVEACEDLLMDKCKEGAHQDCECIYCELAEEIAKKVGVCRRS